MKIVRQQLIVEEVKSNRQATVAELSADLMSVKLPFDEIYEN